MLTRELIRSGAYLDSFQDLPEQPRWSVGQIQASMHDTLAQREQGTPVWVFAYGSLIWNPLLDYVERQPATLPGWHRSFCLRLLDGRACRDQPGRMLALNAGGQTEGVVYRLSEDKLQDELWLLWVREMVHGLYRPIWAGAQLPDGQTVQTLTFVADTTHPLYETDASVATISPVIACATGHLGSNRDYLMPLEAYLSKHDICDEYIADLAAAVRALPSTVP